MTEKQFNDLADAVFAHHWGLWQRFLARTLGKRGAAQRREAFLLAAQRITALRRGEIGGHRAKLPHAERLARWRRRSAMALAEGAMMRWDEHGSARGSYLRTAPLDYVPAHEAKGAPYCDMGGEGLGLVAVRRTTVYPNSAHCRPSTAETLFLVGKNEAGTYFAHAVASATATEGGPLVLAPSVRGALEWIWRGHQDDIVQRQGDIALISGAGPKIPALPDRHVADMEAGVVHHPTHPDLPIPGKGQRIIVARRAVPRAISGTKD